MKKIILTENNVNILLEYMGYVAGWEKLIKYISQIIRNRVKTSLLLNHLDVNMKDREKLLRQYFNNKDIDKEKPINDIIIDEKTLNQCNVFGIEEIEISFIVTDNSAAMFDPSETYIKKNGKFNKIKVIVNPLLVIGYSEELEESLQHELTHAYELLKRYKSKGVDTTDDNILNKYYETSDDTFINKMSYYLSKVEMNAFISEFFYKISHKKVPYENLKSIIKETSLYTMIEEIKKMKFNLENDINYTMDVIEFLKLHPEHCDFFPSFKRHSVKSYQKRLIKVMDFKLNYLYRKMNKIIGSIYGK